MEVLTIVTIMRVMVMIMIMENRDKEENFSYLWQKEKEFMGDTEEELIIIQKKNRISNAEGT